jgi:hypothetical protein
MREPGLAAILGLISSGVGRVYNGRILLGLLVARHHTGPLDRHGRLAWRGL